MKKIVLALVVVLVYCWQAKAQLCTDFTSTSPVPVVFINNVSTTGGVTNISNLGSGLDSGDPTIRYVNNFSTMAVSTYPGGSFDFNVATDSSVGCAIWVDWNGNETLEMSEVVFHTTTCGNGPFAGTVLTPGGTADGNYVMRIMIDTNDCNPDDDPCSFSFAFGSGEVEDYKVTVDASSAPACLAPTVLSASNIEDTTANLGWTENGTATVWDIELVDITAAGAATGTPTATGVSNPYTVAGLTADNNYEYYVRADCGTTDGVSAWRGPFAFRTLCTPTLAPYTEGFETFTVSDAGLSSENCWTATNIDEYVWEVAATTDTPSSDTGPGSDVSDGNYVFTEASEGSSGDAIDLVSPLVDLSGLTAPALSFDYHMYGRDMGTLQVIVSSGGTDTTVLTLTGQQQATESAPFLTRFIDLNAYSGQTIKVIFRGTRGADFLSNMAIDNVVFDELPACPQPFALGAANVTANTADLSWTEFGTATSWDIELVDITASGTATGTPTATGVSNPYTATGLTPDNAYEYYVRADCGTTDGVSAWVGPFAFRTFCTPTETPYTEGFETFTVSSAGLSNENCWRAMNIGSYVWEVAATTDTSSSETGPGPSVSDGNYVFTEATGGFSGYTIDLVSPLVNLSGLTAPTLSFDYHMYGRNMGTLEVIVSSGGTDTTVLTLTGQQQTAASDPFLTWFIDLNAYSGQTISVIFRGTRGASFRSDMAIDNVVFGELPACPQPFALGAANITTNAADLSWTEFGTATSWDIELVDITAVGTATGTPTASGVSNPYTATGLGSANDYAFYVRANCGVDGTSPWVGPFAFSTLCDTATPPFSENFDASTSLGCGTIVNDGSGRAWEINMGTNFGFTTNHLRYTADTFNAANTWYFTQGLNLTAGTPYTLAYDYGGSGFYTESLRVSYGTAANSGAMTTELANYPSITNGALTSDSVVFTPLADGVYYIGFQAYSAANQDVLYLDNIVVDFTLSTPDLANSAALTYYPNPVGNTLTLKAQNTIESITVYNMLGQEILRSTPNTVDSHIDMSGLANGAYFVKVAMANTTKTIRVIKQ